MTKLITKHTRPPVAEDAVSKREITRKRLATIRHPLGGRQHEPHTAPSGRGAAPERGQDASRWWPRLG